MNEVSRRAVAWLIDICSILGWVAVVAAFGVPLHLAGITGGASPLVLNIVATFLVVVPATVAMAVLEAGSRHATLGKRTMRLWVDTSEGDAALGFRRALARNGLKIAVPWLIGHAAVFELVETGGNGAYPMVLLVAAYVLPTVYAVTLVAADHRTVYDRLTSTVVTTARNV